MFGLMDFSIRALEQPSRFLLPGVSMLSGGFRRQADSGDTAADLLWPASTASLSKLAGTRWHVV